MRTRGLLALGPALFLVLGACGDADDPASANSGGDDAALRGDVTVFAAASLTDVFERLAEQFSADHPDVGVRFNFGPSSGLATQINQGAPADIFASADTAQMDVVSEAGSASGEPTVFAENVLQIAVPAGNPAGINGIADFAREELTLAICAPEVPCGAAAENVFAAAGVTPSVDSLEEDVRAALTKVELGEVDAALVYATDVLAAGNSVEGIGFLEAAEAVNAYPIVTLAAAPNPEAAQAFIEFILSDVGAVALAEAGFGLP